MPTRGLTTSPARLPSSLADHRPLAVRVTVAGAEGTKDSPKNREKVGVKLSKTGLEVVVSDCSTPDLLIATFSYSGKSITFPKKKLGFENVTRWPCWDLE